MELFLIVFGLALIVLMVQLFMNVFGRLMNSLPATLEFLIDTLYWTVKFLNLCVLKPLVHVVRFLLPLNVFSQFKNSSKKTATKTSNNVMPRWNGEDTGFYLQEMRRMHNVKHQKPADLKSNLDIQAIEKKRLRDMPVSEKPITYRCKGHPNRTLALRYGLINHDKDGQGNWCERDTIRLEKSGYVDGYEDRGHYWARLVDFNNTQVRVVIADGADYVSTFYPLKEKEWFQRYQQLENVLKNESVFTLQELAKYHIDVVIVPKVIKSS